MLAQLNHQLIRDEGHRNQMSVLALTDRMREWLAEGGGYRAVLFADRDEIIAYALFREDPDQIYLRQLFVVSHRRRQGVGRTAVELLRTKLWAPDKRLTVDVLVDNTRAIAFWRRVGYKDYCLTLEIQPRGA